MSRAPIMQRHEVVAEAREHRRDEEEDHRHAVHREELVVLPRARAGARPAARAAARMSERLEPREHEEDGRGDEVADADLLVVDGARAHATSRRGSAHERSSRSDVGVAITAGSPGSRAATGAQRPTGGRRHPVAGLDVLRVEDPAGEVRRRVRERPGAERRRLATWVRSGPICRWRSCRRSVAVLAGRAEQDLLAALELGVRRRRRRAAASRASHALELGARLGDDVQRHVRVLEPAELRALPPEDARRWSASKTTWFVWPGITSILRLSSGTQRLWITSRLVTLTSTGDADRNVDLVRRADVAARVASRPRTTAGR